MPRRATPAKWYDYTCFNRVIDGTRIIPFKTPLKKSELWTPGHVMNKIPDLGLVINLCFAQDPYYCVDDFTGNDVEYVPIRCVGQAVPDSSVVQKFITCVETFLSHPQKTDKLIGVHCTHGVNRTGYIICRYLIDRLNMNPKEAICEFETARGHAIDSKEYVDKLCNLENGDPNLEAENISN